jgi:hypothetical protein
MTTMPAGRIARQFLCGMRRDWSSHRSTLLRENRYYRSARNQMKRGDSLGKFFGCAIGCGVRRHVSKSCFIEQFAMELLHNVFDSREVVYLLSNFHFSTASK